MLDFYKSIQTFYYPVDRFLDDLRYENIASEPRTSTIIKVDTDSDYYGLSKRSKDRAIDEQTGYIAIGRDTPLKGTKKTTSIWAGTGKSDYLIVDLGDEYTISKAKILLPWWGGATINNNRIYDWTLLTSTDNSSYTTQYSSVLGVNGPLMAATILADGKILYWDETGFEDFQSTVDPNSPLTARYFKIDISNTYARYATLSADSITGALRDEWDWECGGSNVFNGETLPSPSVSTGDLIDKKEVVASSDCFAAVVEVGIYKKILGRDSISKIGYHQIENDSRQITFYHVPAAAETFTAGAAKKFEPGGFFRNITITTSSSVAAIDEFNNTIYTGGSGDIKCPAYSKMLKFTGSGDVQVVYADTWPSLLNAYSFGGSYSYTSIANDYLVLDFRGISLKWYATVPSSKTPGTVSIELRAKDSLGVWGAWSTLEASLTLPASIAGEKVWEITYESGQLVDDTSYQLRITNLDGNYVSVDAFAGYWAASFTDYNEDHDRIGLRHPSIVTQLYDQKFSGGSIYEFNQTTSKLAAQAGFDFEGDRLLIYSRKGSGYGIIKIFLSFNGVRIHIPGGDADGGLQINLEYAYDIPQAVVFDSNDYFTAPSDGLPWGPYEVNIDKVAGSIPVWLDGIGVHETTGLSVKFLNTTHQDILKSVAEALQLEWDVTEAGIKVVPRLGTDTNELFTEGRGVTIKIADVQDVQQVATMLFSSGADIDGLPLTTVVEDKDTRRTIGRTIQRLYDSRNVGDYFTLIGAARTELKRRKVPQKRITLSTTNMKTVTYGDSFLIKHPELETRVRATGIVRLQSSQGGTTYEVECEVWPLIT